MSLSQEEAPGEHPEIPMLNLADGSVVAEATVAWKMISIKAILREYRRLGADNMAYLALGMQPPLGQFGDLRPEFAAIDIGQLDEDGNLIIDGDEAAIIRNAVHIDPNGGERFEVTDPLEPFTGFTNN